MTKLLESPRSCAPAPDETTMTDRQLLQDFVEHNEQAAFSLLVERHGPMVYGVCRRILGNHHDAEEAFQATFLILARKARSIVQRELLTKWLYQVAYHTALRAKSVVVKRRTAERPLEHVPEPHASEHDSWPELKQVLDQELNRLPDKLRIPILLCDLEGKTGREAAAILNCPQGTVADRLTKARVTLAQRLTRRGFVLSAGSLAVLLSQEVASAAVPSALAATTVKAATLFAAGTAVSAGAISTKAGALATSGLKSMMWTQASTFAGALVV